MALLGISWAMTATLEWFEARKRSENSIGLQRYLAFGFMLLFMVYLIVIVVCVKSQYLSAENFAFAREALATTKDVLAISLSDIPLLFHYSTGEAVLIWIIRDSDIIWIFWHRLGGLNDTMLFKMVGFLASAFAIWVGGAFYWLVVQSGGNQIRYFYPFLFHGNCLFDSCACSYMVRFNEWLRLVMVMICFLPTVNVG